MRVLKSSRFSLLYKPFLHRERVDLVVTMFNFLPFQKTEEPMLEHEAWPVVAELLGDLPIDTADFKARGEWLAWGNACAPEGQKVLSIDVSVRLRDKKKILRVFGEREWVAPRRRSITSTEIKPFEVMPITPARAFGGPDFKDNPAGQGHWPRWKKLERYPLPSIVYPDNEMKEPKDILLPAYFGPRDMMLPERQKFLGTYDKTWAETSFPGVPDDFDDNFFQLAQTDQQLDQYFNGTETFHIENMHPQYPSQTLTLPGIRARTFATIKRRGSERSFEEIPMHTDTVFLFPNIEVAIVVHRGRLRAESMDLKEIESLMGAFEWQKDAPRPLDYYVECRDERTDYETAAEAFMKPYELYPEKWEEPPEKLLEVIKPRDPSLTKDGTAKIDAMWAKWKGKLDEGLASQGLGSYDELVAQSAGQKEDPSLTAIRDEIEKFKNIKVTGPKDISDLSKSNTKLNDMIKNYVDYQKDVAEVHFRKQCEVFGHSYEELKRKAALSTQESPKDVSQFVNAELKRIASDAATPQAIRNAAKAADVATQVPDLEDRVAQLDDLVAMQKTAQGHFLPPAPALSPGQNEDLREELLFAQSTHRSMPRGNFRGADLSGLDLMDFNFAEADFTSATLNGTNFDFANLTGACFAFADMTDTSLKYSHLSKANFGEASIDRIDLFGARLEEANFTKTTGIGANFSMALMEKSFFFEVSLKNINFTLCDFTSARVIDSSMDGSQFIEARLGHAAFIDSSLAGAVFFKATGEHLLLIGGDVNESDFSRADLPNFTIAKNTCLDRCKFLESKFNRANFRGASLIGADFSDAELTESDLSETTLLNSRLCRVFARKSRYHRTELENVDLTGADLMEANFLLAVMRNCEVKDANFFAADFMKTKASDVNFDSANVKRTRIEGFRI